MKVTKWSTFTGDLTVSEQQAEQTSGEPGSLGAGPAVPPSSDAPMAHGSADVESPKLVPEQGAAPKPDAPKADVPDAHASEPEPAKRESSKVEPAKSESGNAESAKAESAKAEANKAEPGRADAPRAPGRIMIMSSGDRAWTNNGVNSEPEVESSQGMFGKRRIAALAAVVALAALAGALGGALAAAGLTHLAGDDTASGGNHALEASIARIDSDILSLKAGMEHTSKLGMSQFNKTSDRLDKVEKAQAEPAAKLAKLSEAVDKLRATPAPVPVAAAPAAPKEVTGSITPPAATAQASATAPKVEVGRLPTVEGWILRDVANGGALIEGRQGVYEVYAGDPVPGLGRVDAIRRQDGRWVVVTSKGLIVAR
jgi:hypothetical protein